MPISTEAMTVGQLREMLESMDADDLPIRFATYEGDMGYGVYSVRKHVVTDEDDSVQNAFVVVNG